MCDREAKAITSTIRTFGRRNTQRFRLLEDLTLACNACRTPEARRSVIDLSVPVFAQLQLDQKALNKDLEKIIRDAARAGGSGDKKKKDANLRILETAVASAIKKEVTFQLSSNSKLKVKYRGLKKSPFVTIEFMF